MTPDFLTPEELAEQRLAARNLIHRFLGNPTGQAETMVEQLNDEEVARIVAAGEVKETARDVIKSVFTAAYERRRIEHSAAATAGRARLQQRSAAMRVLAEAGGTTAQIQDAMSILSDGELSILAELDGEPDVADVAAAIVQRAENRVNASNKLVSVETALGIDSATLEAGFTAAEQEAYEAGAGDQAEGEAHAVEDSSAAPAADEPPAAEPAAEVEAQSAPEPPPAKAPIAKKPGKK